MHCFRKLHAKTLPTIQVEREKRMLVCALEWQRASNFLMIGYLQLLWGTGGAHQHLFYAPLIVWVCIELIWQAYTNISSLNNLIWGKDAITVRPKESKCLLATYSETKAVRLTKTKASPRENDEKDASLSRCEGARAHTRNDCGTQFAIGARAIDEQFH